MKALNNNTQILNVHYRQELTADNLNKIFYKLFTAGVIEGSFAFTSNTVTISSVVFLIHPQNQTDLLVRIDTTVPITITNTSTTNTYLVARYRWENANIGAEFLFMDDINITETDVILVGLVIDTNGKIIMLNYDTQERARINTIQTDTVFPLVSMLDGYRVGHVQDTIPISDGELNETLNAEYFNGKQIEEYAVSKERPIITTDIDTLEETITYPEYPEWMDTDAVDMGEGVTAEYLGGYKIQPQDGTTKPGLKNKIPIANTILQKELSAEYLQSYKAAAFAKVGHRHNLDNILDGGNISVPNYYRAVGVANNTITADSIMEDDIEYRQVEGFAYDSTIGNNYQPVYETGSFTLTGLGEGYIAFTRNMRNARVIIQRVPASEVLAIGGEKRTARIMDITGYSGFTAKQMGSIVRNDAISIIPSSYENADTAENVKDNNYYFFAVGEAV